MSQNLSSAAVVISGIFIKQYLETKPAPFMLRNRNRISPFPVSIGGSVVECSPATRAARVRFPADADAFIYLSDYPLYFRRH